MFDRYPSRYVYFSVLGQDDVKLLYFSLTPEWIWANDPPKHTNKKKARRFMWRKEFHVSMKGWGQSLKPWLEEFWLCLLTLCSIMWDGREGSIFPGEECNFWGKSTFQFVEGNKEKVLIERIQLQRTFFWNAMKLNYATR